MATFTHALQTGNYGESKFIISSNPSLGTHVTIASALAVASSGDVIFIRDGSYTEDLTMVPGVNLVAHSQLTNLSNVTITGKLAFSAAGNYSVSGITFVTNGDFIISATGANALSVGFQNCGFVGTNNTIIEYSNSNAASSIGIKDCNLDVQALGITSFSFTGAGIMSFQDCNIANGGLSVTPSVHTDGQVIFNYSTNGIAYVNSGVTASINLSYSIFNTTAINTTCIAIGSTGPQRPLLGCIFRSGTAASIDIAAGCELTVMEASVSNSNANAITGAGTLNYGGITFEDSFNVSVTTQNQLKFFPKVAPTQQTFTAGVAATYTTPVNCQWIRVRMVGGGGGGGGSGTGATNGATGTASTFSGGALTANPGTGTLTGGAAAGGNVANIGGSAGTYTSNLIANVYGGTGGSSYFSGGGMPGNNAPSAGGAGVFGGGGGGAGCAATVGAGLGGGAAGYVEHIINLPAATYTYTIGTGGAAAAAGVGGAAGGVGGDGYLIVEEYYL